MQQNQTFKPETFGIIGAMDAEIALLKDALENRQSHTFGAITVYTGKLDGKNIALCLSGIGKVNAAIATTILIEHFACDCVINTGSAGGLFPHLQIGDIVIGNEIAHHDVDVTAFGYKYGQVPKQPEHYKSHTSLVFATKIAAGQITEVNQHLGMIVSGDQFISSEAMLDKIKTHFPNALATEMEAAAIAQTCHQFNKPFVIVRAISDNGDSEAAVSFETFLETAAVHSAKMVRALLRQM